MSTLVHSIRRHTLVVGLVVASFAGASGSAYAAFAPPSPYGCAMQYTPKAHVQKIPESLYGYAMQYTPNASAKEIPESLYGYAMQYTPKAHVQKIAQRPEVVVERTGVRCDVSIAHGDDLRCE